MRRLTAPLLLGLLATGCSRAPEARPVPSLSQAAAELEKTVPGSAVAASAMLQPDPTPALPALREWSAGPPLDPHQRQVLEDAEKSVLQALADRKARANEHDPAERR